MLHSKKTAFVIEHDFIMATYLADRVIVFEGKPAIAATATPSVFYAARCRGKLLTDAIRRPQSLLTGMNQFLASLEITFRRDPTNYRPRVNKKYSVKDREQKGACISCHEWHSDSDPARRQRPATTSSSRSERL